MGILHGQGAELMADFVVDGTLSHGDVPTAELVARIRSVLQQGIYGLCFSAYGEGQSPAQESTLSEDQVRQRLEQIAPTTQWIRTFSCTDGNEHAARIAHELGLKTMVGAWIGDDRSRNAAELAAAIQVCKQGHADLVAVGNEVLLRGDLDEGELLAAIEQVKREAPGVPVTYVDAYFLFPQHPRIVEACDVLAINCYPFWEKVPLDHSIGYAQEMVRRVLAVAGDKPVVISETGWPSAGSAVGAAVPSLRNMVLYALNLHAWADRADIPLFWFSAFDEAWKVGPEGDCGAYWGLWNAEGESKLGE